MTALLERLISLLNLRTLALLLGLWLVVAPPSYPALQWLDGTLASLTVTLADDPVYFAWSQATSSAPTLWWTQVGELPKFLEAESASPSWVTSPQTPWWFDPAHSVLALLLTAFVCLLIPKLRLSVALLSSLLVFVVLMAAQLGAAIARNYWLPLGLSAQYLWLGLLLVGCWYCQGVWQRRYQSTSRELGALKMQQGDWIGASTALAACPISPEVLTDLYQQARQHEEQRRVADARRVYALLQQRRRRYRDVEQRLASLQKPPKAPEARDMAQTLVLDIPPTPTRLGRYEIERELGRGAMGIVYLAHDPHIARPLAIKTLNYAHFDSAEREAVKARFFREAEAAGRLRHPGIVAVYDVGEEPELAYIVMDYVQGEPLSQFAAPEKLLPIRKVYEVALQVAEALAYAHSQEVVHRDIKPGNILYRPEQNQVTVTDFGIARIASSARTQTGEIFGSPLYMSPEQLRGLRAGEQSDIFSLGVTFYQLLSGALPFRGENIAELSYQIVQGRHKNIRDLRPQLPRSATRIINKALQKEPESRYASATDMARALSKAIERDF
ncbi:serine/threonine-protein kinase [Marinimicrobium sp. ABcell2]|uniref:serine/threonine-protein kinase n=1 Tax=Marinimicrobium sp. ABcell2 TaxID=3069751 RepID=UPI0027B72A58|nr:serine/threonine-protein kinase [Marinimicrobium sp. ABcell2]MDQ2077282.1 serine/threonine-protein kinase [Marinimicrobium sp. ABcell2]